MNEMFNKAATYIIRFMWKIADTETKKAILKELTPKKTRKKSQMETIAEKFEEEGRLR